MHTRPPVTAKRTPSGCRAVNDGEQTGRSDPYIIGRFTRSTPFSWTTPIVGDALHLTRGHLAVARGTNWSWTGGGPGAGVDNRARIRETLAICPSDRVFHLTADQSQE